MANDERLADKAERSDPIELANRIEGWAHERDALHVPTWHRAFYAKEHEWRAIIAALRASRSAGADMPAGPYAVYENYNGALEIIDGATRRVLSDIYAYDDSKEKRLARMEAIAAALNAALRSASALSKEKP